MELSKERLEGISRGEKCYTHDDVTTMARELLERREWDKQEPVAQPVQADADDNFYSWFGREWHENYQQNQYTTSAKQMLGVMAESAWNACRAAMLSNEPVSKRDELPFDYWLSQQTGVIEVDCGCVTTETFYHWLRVAYNAGNSPMIPDCSCHTCRPVTIADMRFVVCPECGNKRCPRANDHRNACSGSNEHGQEGSGNTKQQEPTK
nr:hypothetical protein [uncultured Enterobacter sp.]